jgi:hypothetical protein
MSKESLKLAVGIATCHNLSPAEKDSSNPCHKIVQNQISTRQGRSQHIPEPWFGNLENARVLGISSNPSINEDHDEKAETFPTIKWTDSQIGDFFINRIGDKDNSFVTFKHPVHNDFLTRCNDGKYRSGTKSETKSQPTWLAVHNRMSEILGEIADPRENYCLTEIVHCKSKNAAGVKQAASKCMEMWLEQKFEISKAPVVIIFGSHARDNFMSKLRSFPADFGRSQGYSELTPFARAMRDIGIEELGGMRRLVLFNFKNGSKQVQELNKVYGKEIVEWIGKVAAGESQVPEKLSDLQQILRDLSAKSI